MKNILYSYEQENAIKTAKAKLNIQKGGENEHKEAVFDPLRFLVGLRNGELGSRWIDLYTVSQLTQLERITTQAVQCCTKTTKKILQVA